MLTLDDLRQFGANVQEGLDRCMSDEGFYLELVGMTLEDASFDRLSQAVAADDRKAAFEAAHALKGIVANVSLTPLYAQVSEMTELLRGGQEADYGAYLARILEMRADLLARQNG